MSQLNNLLIIHPDANSTEYRDLYNRIMTLSKRKIWGGSDARNLKADIIKMASGQDPPAYWFNKGKDLYDKGIANLDKDESEKCIEFLRKATEKDQDNAENWLYKSRALINYGDKIRGTQREEANKLWEEAVEAYDVALKLEPKKAIYLEGKSFAFNRLRRYDESIKVCEELIKNEPNNLKALTNKAYALCGKAESNGDFLSAIHAYDNVIKKNPNYDSAFYCKGIALVKIRSYEEAIQALDKAIEADINLNNSQKAKAWYYKGTALKSLNRPIDAELAFAKAKELGRKD